MKIFSRKLVSFGIVSSFSACLLFFMGNVVAKTINLGTGHLNKAGNGIVVNSDIKGKFEITIKRVNTGKAGKPMYKAEVKIIKPPKVKPSLLKKALP